MKSQNSLFITQWNRICNKANKLMVKFNLNQKQFNHLLIHANKNCFLDKLNKPRHNINK